MKLTRIAKLGMVVGLLAICLATPQPSLAQASQSAAPEQSGEPQTMQALLSEVRQLRLVLQRLSLSGFRAQIMVERLRMQQSLVNQLTSQLDNIRESFPDSKTRQQWIGERIKDLEKGLNQESDPARRGQLEREYKEAKFEAERITQWDQQQRERETQVVARMQIEQAKLSELNDRLEALERELEIQTTSEKPAPKSKQP